MRLSVSDGKATLRIFFLHFTEEFLIYLFISLFYINKEDTTGKTFSEGWQGRLTPKYTFPLDSFAFALSKDPKGTEVAWL